MGKKFLGLLVAGLCAWPAGAFAASTQVDSLIEKLVEKGILTKSEARELKMEIAEDAKALQEDSVKSTLPEWIQNTKIKGDVRVRYQYERQKNDTEARSRGRARFRLGLDNTINDQWKIGAGLATSEVGSTTDDARSTNMTFTDGFRRGDIRLDYAFAQYQPAPWFKGITGKYIKSDYLWAPTDMLWDTDINPAGGSVHLEHALTGHLSAYANSGVWVIDENGKTDRADPFLVYNQGGVKFKQPNYDFNLAGVFYGFNAVKGAAMDGTASTNTLTGTVLRYDYDAFGGSAEFGINNPTAGILPIPRLAFFGDIIQNIDSGGDEDGRTGSAVDEGTGWAAGFKFGDDKVNGKGQWQWKYQYTNLGANAWPDAFPDSDRLGGRTDVRGHEAILEYGLSKNVVLGLDYYQDDRIKGAENAQKLIQA
ncbi:MAG: putative porin, partial [Candidatus Omnitrophica bacterium]|nr:putative porin [Candidatus Omnitrophota bacterium]